MRPGWFTKLTIASVWLAMAWMDATFGGEPASGTFVSSRQARAFHEPNSSSVRHGNSAPRSPRVERIAVRTPAETSQQPWEPYWNRQVREPLDEFQNPLAISQETLVLRALEHSAQVRVYADQPLIRETAIAEARATFDWKSFLDTRWNDLNEPVGSTLTTGNSGRYNNHQWSANGGVRRTNELGGKTEIAQQFGFQNTNSNFFVPDDQGTARLTLSYTQPLLRGAGRCYNSRVVVLAQLDASVAEDELLRQLESHLFEVIRGYWSLYMERGNVAQKRRQLERARRWLAELERRDELDAVQSQLLQGRAVVASREAELYRIENALQNAEARIKALVNAPDLVEPGSQELIPTDVAVLDRIPIDAIRAREMATQYRPEVRQSLKQIKSSTERLAMSRHEILPALDMVLQTYTAGLRGGSNVPNAWTDQFTTGAPSYSAGLVFEVPLGNRAANARLTRRQLELRQITSQMQVTLEMLMLEVDVAVREVETSHRELDARLKATQAAEAEVRYLENRWRHMAGDGVSGSSLLHDLFLALDRYAAAEYSQLQSLVTYNLALINIKKATGTLLQEERITLGRGCDDGLPVIVPDQVPFPFQHEEVPPGESVSDNWESAPSPTQAPGTDLSGTDLSGMDESGAGGELNPAQETEATEEPAAPRAAAPRPVAPTSPLGPDVAAASPRRPATPRSAMRPVSQSPLRRSPEAPAEGPPPFRKEPFRKERITERDLTAPVVIEEEPSSISYRPIGPPSTVSSSRRVRPKNGGGGNAKPSPQLEQLR